MVEVIWSMQARNDLDAIVDHIASDSPSRAQSFHFKTAKHKQSPHNLLLGDVLIQEDRVLRAL